MTEHVREHLITLALQILAAPFRLLVWGVRWAFSRSGHTALDSGVTTCGTCGQPIVLSRMNQCATCGFVSASSLVLPCEACRETPSPYVQCTSCGATNEVQL